MFPQIAANLCFDRRMHHILKLLLIAKEAKPQVRTAQPMASEEGALDKRVQTLKERLDTIENKLIFLLLIVVNCVLLPLLTHVYNSFYW